MQCLSLLTTPAHRWRNPRTEAAKLSSSSIQPYSRSPLLIATSVSTLGGLLFGYDNIVISGAIGYLTQLFHLDAAGTGWAAGCALIGCIIGYAAAGTVADYLGKKKGLALCAVCFALSSAGMLFAANLHQFVAWRLIGGLGIGAASVISPNYIAEIAPTRVRGRCVTLYQLGIVVGILAAVFVNMLIQRMGDEAWNTSAGWRWMFFAGIVPALLFGGMIYPAVESPRWLMKMGRRDQAIRVLAQINEPEIADHEAAEIENSLAIEEGNISELFNTFRRPLLLGIMLAGLQQISGITPLFSFLPEIFRYSSSTSSRFRLCTQRPRTAARICYRLSSGGHWATSRLVADANVRLWHLNPRLISVQVCFRDCLRNELQAEPP